MQDKRYWFLYKKITEFKDVINKKRDDFKKCWNNMMARMFEPKRKRIDTDNVGDVESCYRRLYYQILDQIYQQMENRFENFDDLDFLELCNFNAFKKTHFPEKQIKSLKCLYGQYFDLISLRSELTALYKTEDIDTTKNANKSNNTFDDSDLFSVDEPYAHSGSSYNPSECKCMI
ncbi:unnamed protein product [Diabrotica balteata]|uniref:Uncharacterized protein n=1 Tax=Diabrotica balteata TaxID=107213 RepID=A0A9N9T3G0_DIABA|nr:unnamed protein product [Diabrotica balteata]